MVETSGSSEDGAGKVVWVQTLEGGVQAIPQEVAFLSPFFQREALLGEKGWLGSSPISLPKQITPVVLSQIIAYCQYHRAPGRSDKERKLYDEKYIRMDACQLCQLTSAADALDLRPLVDLASRALARLISGKTPEEIRTTFNLPDDLTEEEKLEPVPFGTDEPRIRLLNRLYAKKRKELAERKAKETKSSPVAVKVDVQASPVEDTRSVEDLLKFIESGNEVSPVNLAQAHCRGSGCDVNAVKSSGQGQNVQVASRGSKKKKKKRGLAKKGDSSLAVELGSQGSDPYWMDQVVGLQQVNPRSPFSCASDHRENLPNGCSRSSIPLSQCDDGTGRVERTMSGHSGTSNSGCLASSSSEEPASMLDSQQSKRVFDIPDCPVEELFPEEGFEDEVCNPELDMEVADFARKLESDWSLRLQELIPLSGQMV